MRVYFDSSAFAKRYVQERHTDVVPDWCEQADEIALSVIAMPELVSAFCRLRREGIIDEPQYQTLKTDLMNDITDALLCDTTPRSDCLCHSCLGKAYFARHGCHSPRRGSGL